MESPCAYCHSFPSMLLPQKMIHRSSWTPWLLLHIPVMLFPPMLRSLLSISSLPCTGCQSFENILIYQAAFLLICYYTFTSWAISLLITSEQLHQITAMFQGLLLTQDLLHILFHFLLFFKTKPEWLIYYCFLSSLIFPSVISIFSLSFIPQTILELLSQNC